MRAVAIARPFFKDLFATLLTIVEAVRAYYKFLPNHTRTMLINYLYKHIYRYIYTIYTNIDTHLTHTYASSPAFTGCQRMRLHRKKNVRKKNLA